ncbi:MAG: 50S ribosomal protein L33 [bacterium]|nr:50S ribosomal protein L33 [bacterium]
MSQDYRAKLECTECHRLNYNTTRNKKRLSKVRLELKKHCKACGTHVLHKETK